MKNVRLREQRWIAVGASKREKKNHRKLFQENLQKVLDKKKKL